VDQVAKFLPGKCKALSSNPNTEKAQKKETKLELITVGEDIEKLEPLCTAGGI
jgi:hypothetical protein